MISTRSNLIYRLGYWLFDALQLMGIEASLYSTSLREMLLLYRSCPVYRPYSCRGRHGPVGDSPVESSSGASCSFPVSLAGGLNMIILAGLIRLAEGPMRLWPCWWLGVAYPYWGRGRNICHSNIHSRVPCDQSREQRILSLGFSSFKINRFFWFYFCFFLFSSFHLVCTCISSLSCVIHSNKFLILDSFFYILISS